MRVSEERSVRDKRLYIEYVLKWEASAVFPGEVLSAGGGVPRERVLQQCFEREKKLWRGWMTELGVPMRR